jgi:hypothetical protein
LIISGNQIHKCDFNLFFEPFHPGFQGFSLDGRIKISAFFPEKQGEKDKAKGITIVGKITGRAKPVNPFTIRAD